MIPFFSTADELKPYFGFAVSDISLEGLESSAINSMSDIAIMVGMPQMEILWTEFQANNLTPEQEALVEKIKKPLANMLFNNHSYGGSINITDSGYTTEEGANAKRLFEWQMRGLRKHCLKSYSQGMAELWAFVVENIADYTDISTSEEFLSLKNRPINALHQWMSAGRRIADWRTHYALTAEMNNVWEDSSSFLSADLKLEVDSYLADGGTDEDLDALLPYIRRYVAHYTIERACVSLPISIEAEGLIINELVQNRDSNLVQRQMTDKRLLMQQAKDETMRAKKKLEEFLTNNANATKYVGYYNEFILNAVPLVNNTTENKIIIM